MSKEQTPMEFLSEELFKKCGNRVIYGDDLGAFVESRLPGGGNLDECLLGLSSAQIGVASAPPVHGYSINHSVLTGGLLMMIQRKNWSLLGVEPEQDFPVWTCLEQLRYLMVEPGLACRMPVNHRRMLAFECGYPVSGVEVYGTTISGFGDWPKWSLVAGAAPGLWDFLPAEGAAGHYSATVLLGFSPESSWFIMHRVPLVHRLSP